METLKRYFIRNFEQSFVLLILVSTAVIGFFVPEKLAFLNFYFLPIILGAYYLGRRMAVILRLHSRGIASNASSGSSAVTTETVFRSFPRTYSTGTVSFGCRRAASRIRR